MIIADVNPFIPRLHVHQLYNINAWREGIAPLHSVCVKTQYDVLRYASRSIDVTRESFKPFNWNVSTQRDQINGYNLVITHILPLCGRCPPESRASEPCHLYVRVVSTCDSSAPRLCPLLSLRAGARLSSALLARSRSRPECIVEPPCVRVPRPSSMSATTPNHHDTLQQ